MTVVDTHNRHAIGRLQGTTRTRLRGPSSSTTSGVTSPSLTCRKCQLACHGALNFSWHAPPPIAAAPRVGGWMGGRVGSFWPHPSTSTHTTTSVHGPLPCAARAPVALHCLCNTCNAWLYRTRRSAFYQDAVRNKSGNTNPKVGNHLDTVNPPAVTPHVGTQHAQRQTSKPNRG